MANASWFMDCAVKGGGTPAGIGKVIAEQILACDGKDRPEWTKGKTPKEIEAIVTQAVCEASEATIFIKEYMDKERSKGRDFDEIYSEVQPYLDYVSRPIDDELKDQGAQFNPAGQRVVPPTFEDEAVRKEARKASAPHRRLADWPMVPRI
eukprot:TRINITY_DN28679_c0_g1_i1.p1 TRINITY_DN28679_c0_g1~~TRINITY_DN28679_c0_g1_i1.p1  ORF type:complete len:151 (+),score=34.74 TRINITY_DN28679_c0_g1_i1:135-587(+)